MEQLSNFAILLTLLGGVHDLLTKRIPNWLTFSGMVLGIALQSYYHGWNGLLDAVLGLLTGFALFIPMYIGGYMGAGDVKLLMLVGAFTDYKECLVVAVFSILFGALYAFGEILFRGRLLIVCRNTMRYLAGLLLPGFPRMPLLLDETRKFSFGLCLTFGLTLFTVLQHLGKI